MRKQRRMNLLINLYLTPYTRLGSGLTHTRSQGNGRTVASMNEDTKQALQLSLGILRQTCIDCGVSIAVGKETGALNFFDTQKYLQERKFDGFKVEIQDLVR